MNHEHKDILVEMTLQDKKIVLSKHGPFHLHKGDAVTLKPPPGGKVTKIKFHCYAELGSWPGEKTISGHHGHPKKEIYEITEEGDRVKITDVDSPSEDKEKYYFGGQVQIGDQRYDFDPEIINKRGG